MRKFWLLGLAAAIVAGVLLVIGLHHGSRGGPAGAQLRAERLAAHRLAQADPAAPTLAQQLPGSVDRAYRFLNQMSDRYAQGPVPRLVQSYPGGLPGLRDDTSSHIYDDALVIDAFLAEHTPGGLARAKVVGNAMLFLQAQAVPDDGRLLNAYAPSPLAGPGNVQVADTASSTGTMAWGGQALVQLYAATRDRSYLSGAIAIATGSSPTARTAAVRAATPAASLRPGPRSAGRRPSTILTCTRSSGCWPGRPATAPGRPGRPGRDASW